MSAGIQLTALDIRGKVDSEVQARMLLGLTQAVCLEQVVEASVSPEHSGLDPWLKMS